MLHGHKKGSIQTKKPGFSRAFDLLEVATPNSPSGKEEGQEHTHL